MRSSQMKARCSTPNQGELRLALRMHPYEHCRNLSPMPGENACESLSGAFARISVRRVRQFGNARRDGRGIQAEEEDPR
jgi:hypothetical protein